jgi:Cu-Zn family superoxide dismutase
MRTRHLSLSFLLLGVGCAGEDAAPVDSGAVTTAAPASALPPAGDTAARAGAATSADSVLSVEMRDAAGRALGTLSLAESASGITVSGRLTGLPPGTHAIHLHTTGRCEPPFTSAGGHWNPMNRQHGTENPRGPHLGDLPNVTAAADSAAAVQVTSPGGTLRGSNSALDADGVAVVVHAGADDYRTDPAGNAGDRIACGMLPGR